MSFFHYLEKKSLFIKFVTKRSSPSSLRLPSYVGISDHQCNDLSHSMRLVINSFVPVLCEKPFDKLRYALPDLRSWAIA